jgi:hypothetical protein
MAGFASFTGISLTVAGSASKFQADTATTDASRPQPGQILIPKSTGRKPDGQDAPQAIAQIAQIRQSAISGIARSAQNPSRSVGPIVDGLILLARGNPGVQAGEEARSSVVTMLRE